MALLATPAVAQESGREARDMSLLMSRYEQALGKLQNQNTQLQSSIRELQRQNRELADAVKVANDRAQGVADAMQRLENTDVMNVQAGQKQLAQRMEQVENRPVAWGDGQRDCKEIGIKHQQLKVTVKPDGSQGVRYLCFDGKVLHLGSELYTLE
ncbi:MAG: hypothetical protein GC129_02395 [Proteobacteria bacterium]|nr:hypothetical protein [Pseudomonadota bacterium]